MPLGPSELHLSDPPPLYIEANSASEAIQKAVSGTICVCIAPQTCSSEDPGGEFVYTYPQDDGGAFRTSLSSNEHGDAVGNIDFEREYGDSYCERKWDDMGWYVTASRIPVVGIDKHVGRAESAWQTCGRRVSSTAGDGDTIKVEWKYSGTWPVRAQGL